MAHQLASVLWLVERSKITLKRQQTPFSLHLTTTLPPPTSPTTARRYLPSQWTLTRGLLGAIVQIIENKNIHLFVYWLNILISGYIG
jgi:hypothetical protein